MKLIVNMQIGTAMKSQKKQGQHLVEVTKVVINKTKRKVGSVSSAIKE